MISAARPLDDNNKKAENCKQKTLLNKCFRGPGKHNAKREKEKQKKNTIRWYQDEAEEIEKTTNHSSEYIIFN